jgi:molybdopterin converting factor small subunit
MPKVIIPSSLRKHANDQPEIMVDGNSFKDAMDCALEQHPGLKGIINDSTLLSMFINSKLIRTGVDNWDKVLLSSDDEISIIIPIAGG